MTPAFRPSPATAQLVQDDVRYAALLPSGPIVVFDGVARVIWAEACDGPAATIVDRVAASTGAEPDEIREDVERFVAELVTLGLLVSGDV
ncbi:PqqD family protein [Agromyces sp. SYSU T00266]|uniref:PqqD family protein n=1 Tax=Agromyces zhanjiangensis TaxID=3158562 RepID=UPI003393B269